MKKILSIVAATALLFGLVSCGSTGGSAKGGAAPAFEHPMTYTLDMADSERGTSIEFVDNSQYGTPKRSTRQNNNTCPEWTKLVKLNKPQVGDKVRVTGILTSDIDIDKLYINLVDNSAAANYWCRVAAPTEETEPYIEIKAGEPYTLDYEFEITTKVAANLILNMAYGEQNDGFAKISIERVTESDIGTPSGEVVDPQHKEPKTWEFDISKNLAYAEIVANYPWENGVQNTMVDPVNYQQAFSITNLFPDGDNPIKGDVLHLTWKTLPHNDVAVMNFVIVDNSQAANWWTELSGWATFAEDVKADEVTTFEIDVELTKDMIEAIALIIQYPVDAADGPSLFTYVRDE